MERILNVINREFLERCLAGTPVDIRLFDDQQVQRAAVIMSHCCLNGPVGVNKQTNFAEGLQGSIKGLLSLPTLSNKSWQATCKPFSEALKRHYPEVCERCQQTQVNGDLWPLHGRSGTVNP